MSRRSHESLKAPAKLEVKLKLIIFHTSYRLQNSDYWCNLVLSFAIDHIFDFLAHIVKVVPFAGYPLEDYFTDT